MKSVTLEFSTGVLTSLGLFPERFFSRYEEVELLETLRLEAGWRLQLLRVRRRGPLKSEAELLREGRQIRRQYGLAGFELVERRPRTRDYIFLVRQRNPPVLERLLASAGERIAPTAPFRITSDRVVASFHGEEPAIRRVLRTLDREEIPYRVLRASSHPTIPDANGERLTPRQRTVMARAWALGYYSVPRGVTLSRLARMTGRSPPALGKMLRRAEGHLVAGYLSSEAFAEEEVPSNEPTPGPVPPSDGNPISAK